MTRDRRGFTLIEVLIMGSVGLMVVSVVWYMISSFTRQSAKLDARLKALQGCGLVVERIRQDLKAFFPKDLLSMVGTAPPRLTFYICKEYAYEANLPDQFCVKLETVQYQFDAAERRLKRKDEVLRIARFEDVGFEVKKTEQAPGELLPQIANYVTVNLTYVPEEKLDRPATITDQDRVRHRAIIAIPQISLADAYSFYRPNPFDTESRE